MNGFGLKELVPLISPAFKDDLKKYLATGKADLLFDSAGTPIWHPTPEQKAAAEAAGDVDFRPMFRSVNYPKDDNQGRIGSCTSWNCIHSLAYWAIKLGRFISRFSAKYCYWWIRKLGGLSTDEDTGGNMTQVGECEIQKGAPLDKTFPDDGQTFDEPPTAAAEAEAPKAKLDATQLRVMPQDFKAAMLATDGPLNIGIPVDQAFENAAVGGWVTRPDFNKPRSLLGRFAVWFFRVFKGILGYHAVLLVAIVTETAPDGTRGEFWIFMNSWGLTGDPLDYGHWHAGPLWQQKYLNDFETYKLKVKSAPTTSYNLTVQKEGQGTIKPVDVGIYPYASGTKVTLTATAASNWAFSDWSGAVTATTTSVSVAMSGDANIKATFTSESPQPDPWTDWLQKLFDAIIKLLTNSVATMPKER